jgi:hypothetical protein
MTASGGGSNVDPVDGGGGRFDGTGGRAVAADIINLYLLPTHRKNITAKMKMNGEKEKPFIDMVPYCSLLSACFCFIDGFLHINNRCSSLLAGSGGMHNF